MACRELPPEKTSLVCSWFCSSSFEAASGTAEDTREAGTRVVAAVYFEAADEHEKESWPTSRANESVAGVG